MIFTALLAFALQEAPEPREPTVIACRFERLPLMVMVIRGDMGADDNTLQIGEREPAPLSVGSGFMTATVEGQEFTFSLHIPASVSVSAPGNDTITYGGECVVAATGPVSD